jgi:glutathione synthase/RimK-type ligase-like ATP-grasp enzyme
VRVTLATCAARPNPTASDALLAEALVAAGAEVRALPWDRIDPTSLRRDESVCIRSTWDYHHRHADFAAWVAGFSAHPGTLWNPPEVVLPNMDKLYLRELERRGIRIPPTEWIPPGVMPLLGALAARRGWAEAVFKPRISATAHGTHLVRAGESADASTRLADAGTGGLLQAFIPEVRSAGELSLVYLAGAYSHAARKVPAPADFRVQHDFGGRTEPAAPRDATLAFGEQVMATVTGPWRYARVDLIETADGPVLMELELIEPDLFLGLRPEGARRLARAWAAGG